MPDTLIIGGQTFTNVAGIKATDINDVIQTFSKGGGGASNIVTGTFKGTTTGTAMDVTLNYSGTGYPLVIAIYPTGGPHNNGSAFSSLIQRYATVYFAAIKCNANTTPTYESTGDANKFDCYGRYKNSTSSSTALSGSASDSSTLASGGDSTSGTVTQVKLKSATKMSVFIASTSYGFAANYEYTYHIIYSS